MLRLIGLALSIGLADSMNPSTIAPAMYLASGDRSQRSLLEFTLAVFGVSLLGGAILVFGPGQLLLSLIPHPGATVRYTLELIAGVVMLIGAVLLWRSRNKLSQRALPAPRSGGRSSALLGASIMAVELPTAFPYFAVIAAIIGSGVNPVNRFAALVIYNLCFVAPLLAILLTVVIAGERAERILRRARGWLQSHWPKLLAGLALVAGTFVALLGITGLLGAGHGTVARAARRFRRVISR
jgi:cytochrome c biogenesis protein CcdA